MENTTVGQALTHLHLRGLPGPTQPWILGCGQPSHHPAGPGPASPPEGGGCAPGCQHHSLQQRDPDVSQYTFRGPYWVREGAEATVATQQIQKQTWNFLLDSRVPRSSNSNQPFKTHNLPKGLEFFTWPLCTGRTALNGHSHSVT